MRCVCVTTSQSICNSEEGQLPGARPIVGSSAILRAPAPAPAEAPGFDGDASSSKSHMRKSVACSINRSTASPVRSMMAHTSSKLRSTNETPFHSSTWTKFVDIIRKCMRKARPMALVHCPLTLSPCCKPIFSAGPPGTVHTRYANKRPSAPVLPPTTRIPKPRAACCWQRSK